MGIFGSLDHIQGKTLYRIMSAACGSAFMLYGWDAGKQASTLSLFFHFSDKIPQVFSVAFKKHHNFETRLETLLVP